MRKSSKARPAKAARRSGPRREPRSHAPSATPSREPREPKDVFLGVYQAMSNRGVVVPFDAADGVIEIAPSGRGTASSGDAVVVWSWRPA